MLLPPNLTELQKRYTDCYCCNIAVMSRSGLDETLNEMKNLESMMTDDEWNGVMDAIDPKRKRR